jgi:ParB family chromosome partitioning protein
VEERLIEEIVVGETFRTDLGDLRGLADSIFEVGLIHPVVVTPENVLVAGERRLKAMELLGWELVPVTVIYSLESAALALQAQRDENTCRKDFTPTEAAALRSALVEVLKPLAEKRKAQAPGQPRGAKKDSSRNLREESASRRETANVAAEGTGFGGRTLDKVDKVTKIAKDESQPEAVRETAREALKEMDQGGKVDAAAKKVTIAQQVAAAVTEFPDLAFYADQGRDQDVIRLAGALRGYDEPERSVRVDALRASIDADRRRAGEPLAEPGPDYLMLGHKVFNAVNNASQVITTNGGVETIRAAVARADQLTIGLWREQFESLAESCRELAEVCKPQLKVISNGKSKRSGAGRGS